MSAHSIKAYTTTIAKIQRDLKLTNLSEALIKDYKAIFDYIFFHAKAQSW